MITKPKIEHRFEQPYVAIRTALPIPFGKYLQQLWGEVFLWLDDKGKRTPGLAIIRYFTTDMSKKLDIDVGFLIDEVVSGDDHITVGFLPAGRYATLLYTGPYKGRGIYNATIALMEWAKESNLIWDISAQDNVEWWNGRVEMYHTDPQREPNPKKYQTELAILIK